MKVDPMLYTGTGGGAYPDLSSVIQEVTYANDTHTRNRCQKLVPENLNRFPVHLTFNLVPNFCGTGFP